MNTLFHTLTPPQYPLPKGEGWGIMYPKRSRPTFLLPPFWGGVGRGWLVGIVFIVLFLFPFISFAQVCTTPPCPYVPLAPLPGQPASYAPNQGVLPSYLATIYKLGIGAAGVLAVLMLVWGGFQYTTSEAIQGKSDAKGIIQNVLWGGAIVLGSYLLLFTINPRLVDIGLALQNLQAVRKTRIPSAQETYGKFLDEALQRAQKISTKAKELKIQGDAVDGRIKEIERIFEEGEWGTTENAQVLNNELNTLRPKLQEFRTKETEVRKYEGTDGLLSDARTKIQQCLNGLGICSVTKVNKSSAVGSFITAGIIEVQYDEKASKNVAKNNAAAQLIVQAARAEVNANKATLIQNGLTEQANALEQKMTHIENSTAFYIRCPDSQVTYVPGKGYESGSCP